MEHIPYGTDDFAQNPEPRVPCLLLLDVSGSMQGNSITQLNDGLRCFKEELTADSLAAKRAEIAIVTFGNEAKVEVDFTTAENFFPRDFAAGGYTAMGQAVNIGIDMLEQRKQVYRANGINHYRPWVFLLTDGGPNDQGWQVAAERARAGDQSKAFAFFAVGTDDANFEVLKLFTPRAPLKLRGHRFRDMFLWLSSSLRSVSRSTPGDEFRVDNPTVPEGWASIV